jgi:hypothetical protein
MMLQRVSAQGPEPAGIFAPAINAANRLLAVAQTPSHGQLTLFMRTVKKTEPPVPSGILSFVSPAGGDVLYLTDLSTSGSRRQAAVHGGSFLGPSVGALTGEKPRSGQIDATVSARQLGTLSARFVRFSTSPEP